MSNIPRLRAKQISLLVMTAVLVGATQVAAAPPQEGPGPTITGQLVQDWINLDSYTPDSTATISIYDSLGGNLLFGPETWTTDSNGFTFLDIGDTGVDLEPGIYIEATDDSTELTKTLELVYLTLDSIDFDTEVVAGRADPDAYVYVFATDPTFASMVVQADSNGDWVADFSQQGFDITPDHFVAAIIDDEDGDATFVTLLEIEPPHEPEEVRIFPFSQEDRQVFVGDTLILRWGWHAKNQGLLTLFLQQHKTFFTLSNGETIVLDVGPSEAKGYWGPIEPGVDAAECQGSNEKVAFWIYELPDLPAGEYILDYHLVIDPPITDGCDYDGNNQPDSYTSASNSLTIQVLPID